MTQVLFGLQAVTPQPSVLTIGNFDGVHVGHRALLQHAVNHARHAEVRSVVMTFDPHPNAVLGRGDAPKKIQPLDDRLATLAASGVDLVIVMPFTHALAALSAEQFVRDVLLDPLAVIRVVVGDNFRFGRDAEGDVNYLTNAGEQHGFAVDVFELLELDGVAVSSTKLRERISRGDMAWSAAALRRPFALTGQVVHGEARGRTLGFPTANVAVADDLVFPGNGVYACVAEVNGERFPAVTNVGVRPTFGGIEPRIEVHLIDVSLDLYGQTLTVAFIARIRDERQFDGIDALVTQIGKDRDHARAMLAIHGTN
ncbi:MAG: bifunctional riboflavin kinase/FAD synthetase [Nitriliruptoraceae bacterium]